MKRNDPLSEKKKYVEARISSAVRTIRKLPSARVKGYFTSWPDIIREEIEILQMEPEPLRIKPSAKSISEMEEVLFVWMNWLSVPERRLLWQRAEKVRWKLICIELGVGRTKAWEMYKCALGKIAAGI